MFRMGENSVIYVIYLFPCRCRKLSELVCQQTEKRFVGR